MLELLREIGRDVETAVKSSDTRMWSVSQGIGADGTETSGIDSIAEEAVFKALERHGNPLNVLSEEAGFVDFGRALTLVVDPLDGTYNAKTGIPFFSVSLAVTEESLSGVSHALVINIPTGDEYAASRGKGAYLNGKSIHTRTFSRDDSVFSIFLGENASDRSRDISRRCIRARSMGSAALEISLVASGSSDLYYYCGSSPSLGLRIVDIAAAYLILREAGGKMFDGNLIKLDMPLDVKKRSSVVAIGSDEVMKVIE